MKQPVPVWAIVAAVAAALVLITVFFVKGASGGDPSTDEIAKIRNAQRSSGMDSGAAPSSAPQ
ncbi:hypothetical protein EON79_03540 [bacterium]|nr:MAG: hypothetical protein EON79_03540 [bacterium]